MVAALICGSAMAADEENVLGEITVTAERRSENIQNVPIAITAVTAEVLESRGISDVAKLANISPNVQLDAGTPFSGSDTVLAAYIRGIGQNDFAFNQDPGVGVYVDGVYLARSVGSNTSMLDVERVEILKGPQGTLFGRNTIGGAISIVTREPGPDFKFKGSVTGGAFNRLDLQASADLPISDKIRSSLSFSSAKRDGYQRRIPFTNLDNLANGTVPGNAGLSFIPDCGAPGTPCSYVADDSTRFPAAGYGSSTREGGVNQWSARGKLVFLPNDDVKFTLSGDYQNIDQSASPNTVLGINPDAAGSLGSVYNACLVGAPIGVICTEPRGGLSPTPAVMPLMPPLSGVNVDDDPFNNRLPYDSRFETGNIDTSYATGNSFSKLKNWGVAATLEWAVGGGAKIKSITAYRDMQWDVGMDLDGSPIQILETSFDMPQHEFSEELQLNGAAVSDRLNYSIGAYYFREAGHLHDYVIFPGGLLMVDGPNDLETKAQALYAHLNFKVTDQFGITVGARYTKETKHFEGHQHDDNALTYKITGCYPYDAVFDPLPFGPPGGIPNPTGLTCQQALGFPSATEPYRFFPPGVQTLDFSNTSPTVGFEYHFSDDVMLYASYSKGYKTGSWTTRLSAPHPVYNDLPGGGSSLDFDPEHATAEELGLKSELLDRRLRLNLAAFHTKYDGIQLNSQQGISPTLVNAGDAKIYGFEAEATAVMGGGFSMNAAFGYTHAEYTRLNNVTDNGAVLTLNSCPLRTSDPNSACDLPKTPKYKFYVGPQYTTNLAGGSTLTFNADWTYTAKLFNDLGNEELLKRDATNIVNASITYGAPEDRWQFTIGGTNLSDERYIVSGQNQGGVAVIDSVYNRPREWFASVKVSMK
jgi:iron complex outermembrane receptor protein